MVHNRTSDQKLRCEHAEEYAAAQHRERHDANDDWVIHLRPPPNCLILKLCSFPCITRTGRPLIRLLRSYSAVPI